jgi:serine/threonine-protein kinase RIO1
MNNNRTRAAKDAAAEELRTGKTQQFQAGRVDDREETNHLSKRVNASVRAISSGLDKERVRRKDKADRATVEQVIDPRTRMILFKLLKNDYIQEIYGTISTGKEANVYHSVGGLTLEMLNRGEKLQAGGARHAAPQRHG